MLGLRIINNYILHCTYIVYCTTWIRWRHPVQIVFHNVTFRCSTCIVFTLVMFAQHDLFIFKKFTQNIVKRKFKNLSGHMGRSLLKVKSTPQICKGRLQRTSFSLQHHSGLRPTLANFWHALIIYYTVAPRVHFASTN